MRHDLPPKPLTPTMQQEVDAIVFKPRRSAAPSAAPAAAPSSPSGYLVAPLPAKPSYVHQARSLAHKHGEDHWSQMNMADGSDNSTPYDLVYSMAHATKDTDDHFGNGMNMAENNDTSMSFDRVYDSRFTHKDSACDPACRRTLQRVARTRADALVCRLPRLPCARARDAHVRATLTCDARTVRSGLVARSRGPL